MTDNRRLPRLIRDVRRRNRCRRFVNLSVVLSLVSAGTFFTWRFKSGVDAEMDGVAEISKKAAANYKACSGARMASLTNRMSRALAAASQPALHSTGGSVFEWMLRTKPVRNITQARRTLGELDGNCRKAAGLRDAAAKECEARLKALRGLMGKSPAVDPAQAAGEADGFAEMALRLKTWKSIVDGTYFNADRQWMRDRAEKLLAGSRDSAECAEAAGKALGRLEEASARLKHIADGIEKVKASIANLPVDPGVQKLLDEYSRPPERIHEIIDSLTGTADAARKNAEACNAVAYAPDEWKAAVRKIETAMGLLKAELSPENTVAAANALKEAQAAFGAAAAKAEETAGEKAAGALSAVKERMKAQESDLKDFGYLGDLQKILAEASALTESRKHHEAVQKCAAADAIFANCKASGPAAKSALKTRGNAEKARKAAKDGGAGKYAKRQFEDAGREFASAEKSFSGKNYADSKSHFEKAAELYGKALEKTGGEKKKLAQMKNKAESARKGAEAARKAAEDGGARADAEAQCDIADKRSVEAGKAFGLEDYSSAVKYFEEAKRLYETALEEAKAANGARKAKAGADAARDKADSGKIEWLKSNRPGFAAVASFNAADGFYTEAEGLAGEAKWREAGEAFGKAAWKYGEAADLLPSWHDLLKKAECNFCIECSEPVPMDQKGPFCIKCGREFTVNRKQQ